MNDLKVTQFSLTHSRNLWLYSLDIDGPSICHQYNMGGKPVIDFIGEVAKHDHTLSLVKPGGVESLMDGLEILIDDEHRRDRLGKAARQEVVAKYTWRKHTRKIIEKLKERCG